MDAGWDGGGSDDISLSRQETEKMSSTTIHPVHWKCLLGAQDTHSLIHWIILACKEAGPLRGLSLGMWDPRNL